MSDCHSEAGRLFQILGLGTEKLLSPSRVVVLGTVRTLAWAERSWGVRSPRSAGSRRPGACVHSQTSVSIYSHCI